MSYRLRTPLSPEPDESLAGLIARNAAKFRFRQPKTLLHRIDAPSQVIWTLCDTDPEQEFGRRLRGLLGIDDAAVFRKVSPWTGDPTSLAIMGHPVWRELLSLEPRTACPLCLHSARSARVRHLSCGSRGVGGYTSLRPREPVSPP